MASEEKVLTGYPSIDKPWLKYYSEEAINAPLPEYTIFEYMWENNKDHLDDIAIIYFNRKITYGELFRNIDKTASAFSALGVKQGDVVSFVAITTPEIIYSFYAVNKLGAVANMLDPRMPKVTMTDLINKTNSKLLITVDIFANDIRTIWETSCIINVIYTRITNKMTPYYKIMARMKGKKIIIPKDSRIIDWSELKYSEEYTVCKDCNAPALIEYTGGTTGDPKGVVLSNANVNAVVEQFRRTGVDLTRGTVWQCVSAPFIAYVWIISMHGPLSLGIKCQVVIYDPKTIAEDIINNKYNHIAANPLVWETVINHPKSQKKDFSHLVAPTTGADYMSPKLELAINEFFQKHGCKYKICQGYGMTEVGSAVSFCISNDINKPSSVGVPFVKTIISTFDVDTQQELKYEETGEICICGPSVMQEYFKSKEATDAVIRQHADGKMWLHTGDLGHIDSDGFIFIDGRIKRMIIKYNGAKVFPPIIEHVISKLPTVSKCSVVGVQDQMNSIGMEPIAFVVPNNVSDTANVKADLRELCQKELTEYAQPVDIVFIDSLPLTPIGKVDYRALEEMAKDEHHD